MTPRRQLRRALAFAASALESAVAPAVGDAILRTMAAIHPAIVREAPRFRSSFNRMTLRIAVDLLAFHRAVVATLGLERGMALAQPFVDRWMDGQFDQRIARFVYANRFLHRLYRRWWFRSANRADEPDGQRFVYHPPAGDLLYGVDVVRCGMVRFLARMGAPELTPFICRGDERIARFLPRGVGFERTGVIALGAARCDFRYRFRGGGPR